MRVRYCVHTEKHEMAKITAANRSLFNEKMKPYQEQIDKIFQDEKATLAAMKQEKSPDAYKKIFLSEEMIHATTLYLAINNLSVEILQTKNTDALNEGRKTIYKAIIYLEEIVTGMTDAAFSEYQDDVAQISNMSVKDRYLLVRKLGLSIRLIIDAYGENTKWKWSFVELEGRFATVAKNLIDFKEISKIYFDPRNPDYDTAVYYLRLVKKLFGKSADEYRDRYELSTRRIDDIRLAISYLIALRRIQILLNETGEAEEIKKKALVWKSKMEADQKKGLSK